MNAGVGRNEHSWSGRGLRLALPLLCVLALGLLPVVVTGCTPEEPAREYVARVGQQYLTRSEIDAALQSLPPGLDSTDAQRQIVEQWVTNALLYDEALRRGLHDDEEVQRLLEENERSVLVSTLLSQLYAEEPAAPTPAEIQTYFERNKEVLRLREPYVLIRYLTTARRDTAELAVRMIRDAARTETLDGSWPGIARRFAQDPGVAMELSSSYVPESQLFASQPELKALLSRMRPDETVVHPASDTLFHVVQLGQRVPAGTLPQLEWVDEELRRRLMIQARKQIYARQVQRLRNEALARDQLQVRDS